jgi:hypothetical protein
MSAVSAFADPNPARTRLRVAALDQWAEAGMALAKALWSERGRGWADMTRIFDRIAQAVRLATLLAIRLCDPTNPAYQPRPVKPRASRPAEADQAQTNPPEKPERRARERLGDRQVSDDAILRRPLKAIVKVICRNLGIVPDWSLWADDDAPPGAAQPAPPPKPVPPPQHLPRPVLHRALGGRRIWISPTEQAPAPPGLRARLRSTASPLALAPIAPRRAVVSACLGLAEATLGARASSPIGANFGSEDAFDLVFPPLTSPSPGLSRGSS